jgi:hypothetical protein
MKTSCEKTKATGSLCAEAKTIGTQFAEQKEFSLPCTCVEDGDFLANPHAVRVSSIRNVVVNGNHLNEDDVL